MNGDLICLAASPAYETGQAFGRALVLLIWISILASNSRHWNNPQYSRLALLSVFFLGGGHIGGALISLASKREFFAPLAPALSFNLMFVFAACLVVSALAIFTLHRQPRDGREKGLLRAYCCGLLALIWLAGMAKGHLDRQGSGMAARPAGEAIVHDEFQCRIAAPPAPWVPIDLSQNNPLAKTSFMRRNPEIYTTFMPETLDEESDISLDFFAQTVKANLLSRDANARFSNETTIELAGIEWKRMEAQAKINNLQLAYVFHLAVQGRHAYQVMTWAEEPHRAKLAEEAGAMAARLTLLDAPATAAAGPVGRHTSPSGAYSIDLTGQGWTGSEATRTSVPGADFAATKGRHLKLAIAPAALGTHDPDFPALVRAMLQKFDLSDKNQALEVVDRRSTDKTTEWRMRHRKEGDDTATIYRLRVLRNGSLAWVAAAWSTSDKAGDLEELDRALDGLRVEPDEGAPRAATLDAPMLNAIGLHYFDRENHPTAQPFFEEARRLDATDADYLDNVAYNLVRMDRNEEALAVLDGDTKLGATSVSILHTRALALENLGRATEALECWRSVLRHVPETDYRLRAMIAFGLKHRHAGEVQEALVASPAPAAKPWLRLDFARLISAHQGLDAALKHLDGLKGGSIPESDIELKRAKVLCDAGEHHRIVDWVPAQMTAFPDNRLDFLYWKGHSQWELEWFQEARATFQEILRTRPNDADAKDSVERLSAILGRGDNTAILEPIEPVPLPDWLPAADRGPSTEPEKDLDYYFLDRTRAIRFEPGQKWRQTNRHLIRIQTRKGVDRHSTLTYHFNPLNERLHVNRLDIYDADGRKTASGNPDSYYILDKTENDMAVTDKILHLPVPGLAPGCTPINGTIPLCLNSRTAAGRAAAVPLRAPDRSPESGCGGRAGRENPANASGRWKSVPENWPRRTTPRPTRKCAPCWTS